MASISLVSSTITSLRVRVTELDESYSRDDREITWYLDGEEKGTSSLSAGVAESGAKRFSNLDPDTEYLVEACISFTDSGSGTEKWLDATFSTDAIEDPSFYVDDYGEDYVTLYIENPYDYLRIFIKNANSGAQVYDSGIYEGYGVLSETVDGLAPGTTYIVNVGWATENVTGNVTWIGTADDESDRTFTTEGGLSDYYWSWTSSNGDATSTQTQTAYEAVTGHGPISDFSYKVWNDLCNRIAEVQELAVGGAWATDGGGGLTLDETCMTSSDKTLTAARFNSMKYNIGRNYATGIADVSPGDLVLGKYFTTITDKLNEWIDTLVE